MKQMLKNLNTLTIIQNSEIKHRRLIPGQKELSNLFDDLSNIFLTDKKLMSAKDENENENKNENENEDEDYENEGDETIDQNKIIKEKKWFFR